MKYLITLIILMNMANAAIPTIEGLFRNPSNPEIDGDMVVLQLGIEEKEAEIKENLGMFSSPNTSEETALREKGYYKFVIKKNKSSRSYQVIQASYKSSNMYKEDLIEVKFYKNFRRKLKNETLFQRNLFYSLLTMYGLNSSTGMSDILSRYGNNYSRNREMMNKEKVGLMRRYKHYLKKIKEIDEGSNIEEIESPFRPKNIELSTKVKKLLNQNMYNDTAAITLTKKAQKFYWQVTLGNIFALFSNTEHKLLFFELKDKEVSHKLYFRNYVLFNGKHQLPKKY